jgi:hypothetical protein
MMPLIPDLPPAFDLRDKSAQSPDQDDIPDHLRPVLGTSFFDAVMKEVIEASGTVLNDQSVRRG